MSAQAKRASKAPEIAISYAGQDWTRANRIRLWLDEAGLAPFFVSPVGLVLKHEAEPLETLLKQVFSQVKLAVCVVPSVENLYKCTGSKKLSYWIRVELDAAIANERRVLFVHECPRKSCPKLPTGPNTSFHRIRPTRERDLLRIVQAELKTIIAEQAR